MAINMDLLGPREGEEKIFAREALIFEEEMKVKRAGRKWKRSHIPTARVLDVYSRPHEERWPVDKVLQAETGAPLKVVWAAMWREEERGRVLFWPRSCTKKSITSRSYAARKDRGYRRVSARNARISQWMRLLWFNSLPGRLCRLPSMPVADIVTEAGLSGQRVGRWRGEDTHRPTIPTRFG